MNERPVTELDRALLSVIRQCTIVDSSKTTSERMDAAHELERRARDVSRVVSRQATKRPNRARKVEQ